MEQDGRGKDSTKGNLSMAETSARGLQASEGSGNGWVPGPQVHCPLPACKHHMVAYRCHLACRPMTT